MTRWQQGDKGNKIITAAGWHPGEPGGAAFVNDELYFLLDERSERCFSVFLLIPYREVIIRGDEVEQFEDL